jgi:SAM-dependent methyltransferase
MKSIARKLHWDNIYQNNAMDEVGWFQRIPELSLAYLSELKIEVQASIIDIGGGDGFFVDFLLEKGYTDISILDISHTAVDRVKKRLGSNASKVNWIIADSVNFTSAKRFDFWHDRASFHFLTDEDDVDKYIMNAYEYIVKGGYLVIGAFSEKGPSKCSGIPIHQYSRESLSKRFEDYFTLISCKETDHRTPSDTIQNYVFCSFYKK